MKNTLKHNGTTQLLLANVDDDTNRLFINDVEIPINSWVGSGIYTQTINGVTISITKIADANGNIMLQKTSDTTYKLMRQEVEQNFQFSHIGQIIQSTTLDTLAKVQAIYGSDTRWIQHSGYILRGATSSVTANNANNDGGADSVSYTPQGSNSGGSVGNTAISVNQMPSHTHKFQGFYQTAYASGDPCISRYKMSGDPQETGPMLNTGGSQNHNHGFTNPKFTGTAATINTLPKYKNVYIWERTA